MAFEASIDRMQGVAELLRVRAATHPDLDFLCCDDQLWTYADTDRRTDAAAAGVADADGNAIPYARLRTSCAPVPQPELTQASLMAIMYTSGTTGMPKGCMLPHGLYLNTPKSSKHMMGYGDGDVLETALPLFHAWAQGMVMGALYNGLRAVIEPQFSPATVVQRWKETGATV